MSTPNNSKSIPNHSNLKPHLDTGSGNHNSTRAMKGDNNSIHSQITPAHRGIKLNVEGIETEMRRDYLHDTTVIIAPNRGNRPYDTKDTGHRLVETASSPRLDSNLEVWQLKNKHGGWQVKVVENKYPSLTPNNPQAFGKQEIVIDTPLANTPFASMSEEQITTLFEVYQKRTNDLLQQNGIEYVLVFRNDGYNAGASLAHAHSQIFALPLVPQKFIRESDLVEAYKRENNRNPYDDIIAYETKSKSRIIAQDEYWLIFCPYASQWPFEFWILPKRQFSLSVDINSNELRSMAKHLKRFLKKLSRHNINHNMYLENGISKHHRFCLKVCGRSNTWGGFEVATGIVINTVPPESAAEWYKS